MEAVFLIIFECILEFIILVFVDFLFGTILGAIFRGIWWVGICCLKGITFSKASIAELKEKYKDSSKPYFLGFGVLIITFLIINAVS